MPNYLENEAKLVEEAQGGNVQAFTSLVNHYERGIYRLALHITSNPEDAEEVLQEAFLKAYSNLGRFEGKSRFYTWLVRIAVNEALMLLRRQRRAPRLTSLDEPIQNDSGELQPREIIDWDENPEQRYAKQELQQILTEAMSQLKPAHRTVFVLRDIEDMSTAETAALLKVSDSAVKLRLFRARLELRERLSKNFKRGLELVLDHGKPRTFKLRALGPRFAATGA